MIARLCLLACIAVGAAGCKTIGPASVMEGECKIFERPPYAVVGRRIYDQDWIDSQVEGGVGGCGWKRPAARPAALDAVPGRKAAVVPKKRPGIVQRIKARMAPATPVPVSYITAPVLPAVAMPQPAPLSEPADELLQPSVGN